MAATTEALKESVKESLLGTTVEPQLSQQSRATFEKHARKDEEGEKLMTEDDFINAIAPMQEDYVSVVLIRGWDPILTRRLF